MGENAARRQGKEPDAEGDSPGAQERDGRDRVEKLMDEVLTEGTRPLERSSERIRPDGSGVSRAADYPSPFAPRPDEQFVDFADRETQNGAEISAEEVEEAEEVPPGTLIEEPISDESDRTGEIEVEEESGDGETLAAGVVTEPVYRALEGPGPRRNGRRMNGSHGMVNGRRAGTGRADRVARTRTPRRWSIAVVLVALLFVGMLAVVFAPLPGPKVFVDGDSQEWAQLPTHQDPAGDAGGGADLRRFGVIQHLDRMYASAEVADTAFGKSTVGSLHVFVDRDGAPSTGFSFRGLGADLLGMATFADGKAASAGLYRYEDAKEAGNWSGFVSVSGADAAVSDGFAELGFPLPRQDAGWRAALIVQSGSGGRDYAEFTVGEAVPSLRVQVESAGELIDPASPVAARLVFEASGGDVQVDAIDLGKSPVRTPALPITVLKGETKKVDLTMSSSPAPGATVSVSLSHIGTAAAVTMIRESSRAVSYFQSVPAAIRVDGAIADWVGTPQKDDTDPVAVPLPRLDIANTRASNQSELGGPAFLVNAKGVAMQGDPMPAKTSKPAPGPGGGPVVLPRLNGEDSLLFYLDVGPDPQTGLPIGGIGADYLVGVTGADGRVSKATIAKFTGGTWAAPRPVSAESQGASVELALAKSDIDWTAGNEIATYAILRGWDGTQDSTNGVGIIDPVILNSNGSVYVSTGGSYGFTGTAPGAGGGVDYVDLVGSGGTFLALRNDGAVYATDDLGASWTQVAPVCVNPPGNGCPVNDFSTLATDGAGSFYAVRAFGEGYRCILPCMTTSWDFLGGGSASADLKYDSGSGVTAVLFGIITAGNSKIRRSTDGGDSWDTLGIPTPTSVSDSQVSLGIFQNGSTPYYYVLSQSGALVFSSNNGSFWDFLAPTPPAPPSGQSYVEMSIDPSNGRIYIAASDGTTNYWQPGDLSWTSLGGPVSGGIIGIAYVPELSPVVLAGPALLLGFVFARRRRRRPQA